MGVDDELADVYRAAAMGYVLLVSSFTISLRYHVMCCNCRPDSALGFSLRLSRGIEVMKSGGRTVAVLQV